MDKKAVLKESVRKLLELKIPDNEIITNLKDVGVSEEEARHLLEETRAKIAMKKEKEPYKEALKAAEEIADSGGKKKEEEKTQALPGTTAVPKEDIAKLWEKGILATVDSKLYEMQKIKDELDSKIEEKTRQHMEKEIKKIEVLLESQKTLLVSKVDSSLEDKKKEIISVIDAKMAEIKRISELTDEALKRQEAQNKFSSEMVKTLNEKIEDLENTKSRMLKDLNSSIIENNSKVEEMLKRTEAKRNEIDARINRALELESKIMEGLLKDAEAKIDKMTLAKSDEFIARINEKIKYLETIQARVNLDAIDKKLKEIDAAKSDLEKVSATELAKTKDGYNAQLEMLKKQSEKQINEMFKSKKAAWNKTIKGGAKEIENIKKTIDLEKIEATMEALEVFKQQFIKTVEKNVKDFNRVKREVTSTLEMREKAIDEHIKAIDAKMAELDAFERNFAKEMGLAIDKLAAEEIKPKKKRDKK